MTIAAGFRTENGVLLCADQLHVGPSGLKSYSPKIIAGEIEGTRSSRYGFAYAGSVANAHVAIRNIQKTIRLHAAADFDELLEAMEKSIRTTYYYYVAQKPESERDVNRFELLIAINRDGEPNTEFMATADGALNPVEKNYHFIGVGAMYGECVGRVMPGDIASLETAVLLANRSLATAKRYTNDCGGASDFTFICQNPKIPKILTFTDPFVENYVSEYEEAMDRILLACVQTDTTDDLIAKEFQELSASARLLRFKWRSVTRTTAMFLKGIIPISKKPDPQSTTADSSSPPPSPE